MKQKFRITYYGKDESKVIFTTIIMANNINSANKKAQELEPFVWGKLEVINLKGDWSKKIDAYEFGI